MTEPAAVVCTALAVAEVTGACDSGSSIGREPAQHARNARLPKMARMVLQVQESATDRLCWHGLAFALGQTRREVLMSRGGINVFAGLSGAGTWEAIRESAVVGGAEVHAIGRRCA